MRRTLPRDVHERAPKASAGRWRWLHGQSLLHVRTLETHALCHELASMSARKQQSKPSVERWHVHDGGLTVAAAQGCDLQAVAMFHGFARHTRHDGTRRCQPTVTSAVTA